jgi:hypothetical protein
LACGFGLFAHAEVGSVDVAVFDAADLRYRCGGQAVEQKTAFAFDAGVLGLVGQKAQA